MYEGSFSKGKMHGKGTVQEFNYNIRYTGDMNDGQITGQGKYTYSDGSEYDGSFVRGKFQGEGQFTLYAFVSNTVRTMLCILVLSKIINATARERCSMTLATNCMLESGRRTSLTTGQSLL